VKPYRLLDLFSGIGGFSLGLERSGGFQTVAFCEIEPYCRRVLAKHWPEVPCYDDIRTLTAERLAADGIGVDAICGGFPCQDISLAGKGAGIEGERSGLWSEYARLIGELRPRYVIVENVSALLGRGLDRVLGDLATLRYDAEWHCIPASAVGAPHRRDRLWLVAHAQHRGLEVRWGATDIGAPRPFGVGLGSDDGPRSYVKEASVLADTHGERELQPEGAFANVGGWFGNGGQDVADANSEGLPFAWSQSPGANWLESRRVSAASGWWAVEPDVGRVAHGVPKRVDRLRALGNSVVPQIPELIGRAIMAAERTGTPQHTCTPQTHNLDTKRTHNGNAGDSLVLINQQVTLPGELILNPLDHSTDKELES